MRAAICGMVIALSVTAAADRLRYRRREAARRLGGAGDMAALGGRSRPGGKPQTETLVNRRPNLTPDRRPILALTQFWCIRGLVGAEESGLKEIELSTAIHLAFHQLELCHLALCLAVRPSQSDCGADGGLVFDDPGGE